MTRPFPRADRLARAVLRTTAVALVLLSPPAAVAGEDDDARAPDRLYDLAVREPGIFPRLSLLARIAENHPGSPRAGDALFERVELFHLTGDVRATARAAARFRAAWQALHPDDPRLAAAIVMEVGALLADRQYAAAQQRLNTLEGARLSPADRAAVDLALAESFLGQEKPERARTYLERVVASGEGDLARAYRLLARIARERGDVEEAARLDVLRLRAVPDELK